MNAWRCPIYRSVPTRTSFNCLSTTELCHSIILEFDSQRQHFMHTKDPVSSDEDPWNTNLYVNFTLGLSYTIFRYFVCTLPESYSKRHKIHRYFRVISENSICLVTICMTISKEIARIRQLGYVKIFRWTTPCVAYVTPPMLIVDMLLCYLA